jgi:hypothetical protein
LQRSTPSWPCSDVHPVPFRHYAGLPSNQSKGVTPSRNCYCIANHTPTPTGKRKYRKY